jgi:rhomboid family GlyGly-CTERM serine protease
MDSTRRASRRWELVAWSIILMVLHVPLLAGGNTSALALDPHRVIPEWWRLFTHPFVHVSWYHLALDGTAFLFLWHGQQGSLRNRLGMLAASAAGATLFAALGAKAFWTLGLCGLSGVAHGLMAAQALDLCVGANSRQEQRLGWALLIGVLGKCVFEALTGAALFAKWHFGNIGTPIVICHLGGACGAIVFKLMSGRCVSAENSSRDDRAARIISGL